jgi:hypothetical protein
VASDLPVDVHITGDFSVFEHLASTFRWRRWRNGWRRWRTGTTRQQNGKKSQRQHAFPKIVHRTTRDEWKSNFRDPTDHGRPDHSFFIDERSASASESAVSEFYGCRFCVAGLAGWRIGMCIARHAVFASKLAPTVGLGVFKKKSVGSQAAIAGKPAPTGIEYIAQISVGCQADIAGKPAPTGIEYIAQISVGCQAAIAGKPAPTGIEYIAQNRSARRPSSLASQLPQGLSTLRKIGRLAGRHRWQASSHRD